MKRYFSYTLVLTLFLVCLAGASRAQYVQVEAALGKVSIPIGDQTVLQFTAHIPAKSTISFPQLADSIGKIQIVKVGKPDTLIDKNKPTDETITQNYTVTGFEAGAYRIPQYTFKTPTASYTTDSLLLQVTTIKVDTTKAIYDIKQPFLVSYTFWDWLKDHWIWVVVTLALILIAIGITYYFQTRPKKGESVKNEPILPLHVIATNKLNALRDKKLWQQGEVKLYYSELTDILRDYLEKRYGIQAHEQTTDEIFAGLRYKEIKEADRNKVRQVLVLADLVKFAKENPSVMENEQSMDNAINFVAQTKPEAPSPETKEELPK
jgi:hypothetical protein